MSDNEHQFPGPRACDDGSQSIRWRCFRVFLKIPQVSLFVLFDWESFFVDWPLKLKVS